MNILICGATNYGNVGDDCIRDVMVDFISKKFPTAIIKCTRPYPQKQLVEWADKVILGGGGILYDKNDTNFDYYVRKYLQWSVELNKPICLCSIGVQALEQEENIELLRSLLSKVKYISVRQMRDYLFFNEHNLSSNVVLADDLGLLTNKGDFTFTADSEKLKVCIVPHMAWDTKTTFLEEVKKLIFENNKEIDFYLTTSAYEDLNVLEELIPLLEEHGSVRDFKYLKPMELVSLLGEMDYVLTSRFHCAIFAHIGGCKNIFSLSFNDKLKQLVLPFDFNCPIVEQRGTFVSNASPNLHLNLLYDFLSET